MILAETYTELMTDPAHGLFEVTYSAVEALLVYLVARPLLRRWRDRFHRELDAEHGVTHVDVPAEALERIAQSRARWEDFDAVKEYVLAQQANGPRP